MAKHGVLFVCLGNICRSPLGEGVFRHLVEERGLQRNYLIDSCGTGAWHIGSDPHPESQRIAAVNGISLAGQVARKVRRKDFAEFDTIVAMDRSNRRDLLAMAGSRDDKVVCLREYDDEGKDLDVPDPYYGGPEGYVEVFEIVYRCCERLLDELESE